MEYPPIIQGERNMKEKPVYSTKHGDLRNKKNSAKTGFEKTSSKSNKVKMRLEKNGRGGKLVTVLFELPFSDAEAKALMKDAQSLFGVGATYKQGRIELRGDVRDRLVLFLQSRSIQAIRAGG